MNRRGAYNIVAVCAGTAIAAWQPVPASAVVAPGGCSKKCAAADIDPLTDCCRPGTVKADPKPSKKEPKPKTSTPEGELDGRCYGNGTCNGGLDCVRGRCRLVGGEGGPCDAGGSCDPGLRCKSSTCVPISQGAEGGVCYGNGTCNDPLDCVADRCLRKRGTAGNACLAGERCDAGLECRLSKCVSTGHEGEPCQAGDRCTGEMRCIASRCVQTGGVSQPCGAGDACDAGLSCLPADHGPRCVVSGIAGEACRPIAPQCDGTLECRESRCLEVGGPLQPCRADGACDGTLDCIAGGAASLCGEAGEPGQPCLPTGGCDPGNACVTGACIGPDEIARRQEARTEADLERVRKAKAERVERRRATAAKVLRGLGFGFTPLVLVGAPMAAVGFVGAKNAQLEFDRAAERDAAREKIERSRKIATVGIVVLSLSVVGAVMLITGSALRKERSNVAGRLRLDGSGLALTF